CGLMAPAQRSTLLSANSRGLKRPARANVPSPARDWFRNDRRLQYVRKASGENMEGTRLAGRQAIARIPPAGRRVEGCEPARFRFSFHFISPTHFISVKCKSTGPNDMNEKKRSAR